MQLLSIKALIAMLWVSTVSIAGVAAHLNSVSSWTVLAGVAVVPPLIMMWRWQDPRPAVAEPIQEARR